MSLVRDPHSDDSKAQSPKSGYDFRPEFARHSSLEQMKSKPTAPFKEATGRANDYPGQATGLQKVKRQKRTAAKHAHALNEAANSLSTHSRAALVLWLANNFTARLVVWHRINTKARQSSQNSACVTLFTGCAPELARPLSMPGRLCAYTGFACLCCLNRLVHFDCLNRRVRQTKHVRWIRRGHSSSSSSSASSSHFMNGSASRRNTFLPCQRGRHTNLTSREQLVGHCIDVASCPFPRQPFLPSSGVCSVL